MSETAAALARLAKCEAKILSGGYAGYRQHVQQHLSLEDRYVLMYCNMYPGLQFRKSSQLQVPGYHRPQAGGQGPAHPGPGGGERGAGAGPGHHGQGGGGRGHPGDVREQDHAHSHLAVFTR